MYTQNIEKIESALANIPKGFVFEINHIISGENEKIKTHTHKLTKGHGRRETFLIFPGVTLTHILFAADHMNSCNHINSDGILEINYCRYGRVGWDMIDGQSIYLGPDDFSINAQSLCANSVMELPSGFYEGITITIDCKLFNEEMPKIIADSSLNAESIHIKYCPKNTFTTFTGNELTRQIFSGFFTENETLKKTFFKVKFLDLLLFLIDSKKEFSKTGQYQSEQTEIIKEIHDYMLSHLNEKITIESLSSIFHMNTTTIKQVFKGVYGDSIASHIREHRMEHAAKLLETTNMQISEIATEVGYNAQSKFSQSFQEAYGMLPMEYRKKRGSI